MKLAVVWVPSDDHYEADYTALVPDDWTPAQIQAAMANAAAADPRFRDRRLSTLIAAAHEDSLSIQPVPHPTVAAFLDVEYTPDWIFVLDTETPA